jgi:serine/threonine protein kinase
MTLPGGWHVLSPIGDPRRSHAVRYHVEDPSGERAFLKAFDFSRAVGAADFPRAIKEIADAFLHNRNLVQVTGRMDKIVRGLAHGEIKLEGSDWPVMYLIFELADGDVRDSLAKAEPVDHVWRLRVLHQAAQALQQLHVHRIYHQNVKPGHLLNVEAGIKLGDLSSAANAGTVAPLVKDSLPGDAEYAPPECLYDFEFDAGNLDRRRQARDMYLFGSLILFLYAQVTTTTALLNELDFAHHPDATSDSYESLLPHLQEAFDRVVESLGRDTNAPPELVTSFRELCHPDPRRRGHPRSRAFRHGSPYSLVRYISRIGALLKRAEFEERHQAA